MSKHSDGKKDTIFCTSACDSISLPYLRLSRGQWSKSLLVLRCQKALVYLDNVLIYSCAITHTTHLQKVLAIIDSIGLCLKTKKYTLATQKGHKIMAVAISSDSKKGHENRAPFRLGYGGLKSFLGIASYYR